MHSEYVSITKGILIMIQATRLRKRYGDKTAVDDVSFTVQPGSVTGFLGPNGAGKSTTIRMVLGLDAPTSGAVKVNGRAYAEHKAPLREVGALLDGRGFHPRRSARNHLRAVATTHGIGPKRVDEVIALTGLESVAHKRAGTFSLGMGQRLGIATALLGDPATIILDEPVNGLDPDGVIWVRHLARSLAREGRTVFLSSHLMSEMAQTADHLIVLGRGKVLVDAAMDDVLSRASTTPKAHVATSDNDSLLLALRQRNARVSPVDENVVEVVGLPAAEIGRVASEIGAVVHQLSPVSKSLEQVYLELTRDETEYRAEAVR
jgi:ABC-2 type transport system ATP-binding protein